VSRIPTVLAVAALGMLAACGTLRDGGQATGRLAVRALAGPQCPVEPQPPIPACEPKPVAIPFSVLDDAGQTIAHGTTPAGAGLTLINLSPGTYTVQPRPRTPQSAPDVAGVSARAGSVTVVVLQVDTGIR